MRYLFSIGIAASVIALGLILSLPKKEEVSTTTVNTEVPALLEGTLGTAKITVKNIKLEANQMVILNTEVNYNTMEIVMNSLRKIKDSGFTEAYLIIDSPGGSVFDGAKLLTYIQHSGLTVHTVCDGLCASMGAQIHQVGKKRYMTPNSMLMFHDAYGGLRGNLEQMNSQLDAVRRFIRRWDSAIAKRAGISYERFSSEVLSANIWIDSNDAIGRNLTDGLVFLDTPPQDSMLSMPFDVSDILRKSPVKPEPKRRIEKLEMLWN